MRHRTTRGQAKRNTRALARLSEDYPSEDLPGLWSFSSVPARDSNASPNVESRWADSFDEFGSGKCVTCRTKPGEASTNGNVSVWRQRAAISRRFPRRFSPSGHSARDALPCRRSTTRFRRPTRDPPPRRWPLQSDRGARPPGNRHREEVAVIIGIPAQPTEIHGGPYRDRRALAQNFAVWRVRRRRARRRPGRYRGGAARPAQGARTLLVERYGFLGGMGTAAGVSTFCGLHAIVHGKHEQVVHGVADDILDRHRARSTA